MSMSTKVQFSTPSLGGSKTTVSDLSDTINLRTVILIMLELISRVTSNLLTLYPRYVH